MNNSNFRNVEEFHEKFDLPMADKPTFLPYHQCHHRIKFMEEELTEFKDAAAAGDLAGQADALIDLVYVAMGTAVQMGLPWEELWADVHRANMEKERGESRRSKVDVIKPPGWVGPQTEAILAEAKYGREAHG